MKIKKSILILITISILAAFLRFNKLTTHPPALNLDEVAIGYNSYSILKTGRDEYGIRFPLAFRSHDDYKPPLYFYLTVPSIVVFGLNTFAIRFPSALAGTLTVVMTYFLTSLVFKDSKWKNSLPILSSGLLAISPWHLQFSRAAYETNVAVFFIVLGIWAFFKGLQSNKKWWFLTSLCFALAIYTYQATRIFIPLLGLSLLLLYRKNIYKNLKLSLGVLFFFLVMVLPLFPIITSEAGVMRFKGTSVFEHPTLIEEEFERSLIDAQKEDMFSIRLLHNRRIAGMLVLMEGYLKHFRPDIIFLGRKGPPFNFTPNIGLLYLIELPFLIWGFHILWKEKIKEKLLITLWLLFSPIASSLTWDAPSSTRMTIAIPTFQLISALGLLGIWKKINTPGKLNNILKAVVILAFTWNIAYYFHQYYLHSVIEYAQAWQYGYKQAVEFTEENKDKFDRIIVSTELKQPQNFFAFYSKYDPWTYINIDGGTVSGGFLEDKNKFNKYEFHTIDYLKLKEKNIMLVDLYRKMPDEYKNNALRIIYLPNGEPEIIISRT